MRLNQYILWFIVLLFSIYGCQQKQPIVKVSTKYGEMYFSLHQETPKHKSLFIKLANEQHYDQFTFNRVSEDFVIQGGCPDEESYFKDSPYLLNPEFHDHIKHEYGALGIGRDNNPKKQSNVCQFYIVANQNGLPRLDGDYMIIGSLLKGHNVLEIIEHIKTDSLYPPLEAIPLQVEVLDISEKEVSAL